jgi:DNA-binding NarL/FixJ family response regulator
MLAQAKTSVDPLSAREEGPVNQPRVLLADDRSMVLERVRSLLHPMFQVVGTADNGEDLVSEAIRLQPDVIVLDIAMPTLTGIEAAHKLRDARSCSKIVFLTVHAEPEFLDACFAEGALGYVTKWRLRTDLVLAINEALVGRRFISPSLCKR